MKHKHVTTTRIRVVSGVVIAVALVLVAKLYVVQVVRGDMYAERGDRQYVRHGDTHFDRGSISFETKTGEQIDAATIRRGYTIAINPTIIQNPEDTYNVLSGYLDIDADEFVAKATKEGDPYEVIAEKVSLQTGKDIYDIGLKGVSVIKEKWRFYPGKELAAHVLGFMSYNNDEFKGQYGLERYYNDVLSRGEETLYTNFFVELFSGIGKTLNGEEKQGSLVTTIEPTVQSFIEKEISSVQDRWYSRQTGAIVMDPHTGEIYAMALSPAFDVNQFNLVEDVSVYGNPLVESAYEMGSVVKPLTLAIGLEHGAVTPNTTYDDPGSVTRDGYTFYNHDKKSHGVVTIQDIINNSLNTGAAFIAEKTGGDVFAKDMMRLIGEKTGIDLPNEAAPQVGNLKTKRGIEIATASFGQGIAMTPIGMTRALAALGNGGYLVHPHIVKKIDYEIGGSKKMKIEKGEQIFSPKTSEEVSRVLVEAVDSALLGGDLALPNHTVAAKTGTAQIARQGQSGYYDDRFMHTFFGYFPAYDPQFIVFLYTLEPRGAQYSSDTLAVPLMNISRFLINYYEIPPDRETITTETDEENT